MSVIAIVPTSFFSAPVTTGAGAAPAAPGETTPVVANSFKDALDASVKVAASLGYSTRPTGIENSETAPHLQLGSATSAPGWMSDFTRVSEANIAAKFSGEQQALANILFDMSINPCDPEQLSRQIEKCLAIPTKASTLPCAMIMAAFAGDRAATEGMYRLAEMIGLDEATKVLRFDPRRQYNVTDMGPTPSTMTKFVESKFGPNRYVMWPWISVEHMAIKRSRNSIAGNVQEMITCAWLIENGGCRNCKSNNLAACGGSASEGASAAYRDFMCLDCHAHYEHKNKNPLAFKNIRGQYKFREATCTCKGDCACEWAWVEINGGGLSPLYYRMLKAHNDEAAGHKPIKHYLVITVRGTNTVWCGEISRIALDPNEEFHWLVENYDGPVISRGPTVGCTKSWIGASMNKIGTLPCTLMPPEAIDLVVKPLDELEDMLGEKPMNICPSKNMRSCRKCCGLGFRHLERCGTCKNAKRPNCPECEGIGLSIKSFVGRCTSWDHQSQSSVPCEYAQDVPDALAHLERPVATTAPCTTCGSHGKIHKTCAINFCVSGHYARYSCRSCSGTGRDCSGRKNCPKPTCRGGLYSPGLCRGCAGVGQYESSCGSCSGSGAVTTSVPDAIKCSAKNCVNGSYCSGVDCRNCEGEGCDRTNCHKGKHISGQCNSCSGTGVSTRNYHSKHCRCEVCVRLETLCTRAPVPIRKPVASAPVRKSVASAPVRDAAPAHKPIVSAPVRDAAPMRTLCQQCHKPECNGDHSAW
jgi:hypothetical protein